MRAAIHAVVQVHPTCTAVALLLSHTRNARRLSFDRRASFDEVEENMTRVQSCTVVQIGRNNTHGGKAPHKEAENMGQQKHCSSQTYQKSDLQALPNRMLAVLRLGTGCKTVSSVTQISAIANEGVIGSTFREAVSFLVIDEYYGHVSRHEERRPFTQRSPLSMLRQAHNYDLTSWVLQLSLVPGKGIIPPYQSLYGAPTRLSRRS